MGVVGRGGASAGERRRNSQREGDNGNTAKTHRNVFGTFRKKRSRANYGCGGVMPRGRSARSGAMVETVKVVEVGMPIRKWSVRRTKKGEGD